MSPTTLKSGPPIISEGGGEANASGEWWEETINGGSLRHVNLDTGSNGWASPPGDLFQLRGKGFFSKRQKSPGGEWLLKPAGVDWLRSSARLDHILARPDNRVISALRRSQSAGKSLKSFVLAINLQVPGRDQYSAVFYFAAEDPIPADSLLYRFVYGDDAFRNARFKIVNRIVKGPWIVRAAVGNYAACLLGRALTCRYHRGDGYLEIDVDIASSAIASAILHLALGYVTSVTIDMGFVVEAVEEDELPERLIGAVRVAQIEMGSAMVVEEPVNGELASSALPPAGKGKGIGCCNRGFSKVNHHGQGGDDEDIGRDCSN